MIVLITKVEFLSEISFRRSENPLKSRILTFCCILHWIIRGKFCLSRIISRKSMPSCNIHNPCKVFTFRGLSSGDSFQNFVLTWLRYSFKRVNFPMYNPQKYELSTNYPAEKFAFHRIFSGKFPFFHEYLSRTKTDFENTYLQAFIGGLLSVDSWKKPRPENLILHTVPLKKHFSHNLAILW